MTAPLTSQSRRSSSRPISGAQGAWLVAEREITTRLRSKAFLISTGILLLVVLGGVVISGLLSQNGGIGSPTQVATVAGASGEQGDALTSAGFEVTEVGDRSEAEQLVRDGDVEAAIVPGGDTPLDLTVVALDSAPSNCSNPSARTRSSRTSSPSPSA